MIWILGVVLDFQDIVSLIYGFPLLHPFLSDSPGSVLGLV